MRTHAKIILLSLLVFGTPAAYAGDAEKQGLSLDTFSVPLVPPDTSIDLAPDQPKPGVTGPATGYGPIPAKNGMQMPFLGLTVKVPIDSGK